MPNMTYEKSPIRGLIISADGTAVLIKAYSFDGQSTYRIFDPCQICTDQDIWNVIFSIEKEFNDD